MADHLKADKALEAQAKAGDPAAQFAFAGALHAIGRGAEARDWLRRAAEANHSDAQYTLATWELLGAYGPKDLERANRRLQQALALGSNSARRLLSVLAALGVDGASPDWPSGRALMFDAAKADDPIALTQIGLLVEMAAAGHDLSRPVLRRAARLGGGLAAFAVIRRHLQGDQSASADELRRCAAILGHTGHPLRELVADLDLLSTASESPPLPEDIDWHVLSETLQTPPRPSISRPRQLCEQPSVIGVEGLLSQELCDYLIGRAAPLVRPSMIQDPQSGQLIQHRVRTSGTAALSVVDEDLVVHCLNMRMADAAELPRDRGEMLSVLKYEPGQQYRPHFDFFSDGVPDDIVMMADSGQRIRTLLVYLNDNYAGGETLFLSNGYRAKGKPGDAILFSNVDDQGTPNLLTRHAGTPVTSGVKWLGSKWFRARPYRYP